jgi:hypothetical protein
VKSSINGEIVIYQDDELFLGEDEANFAHITQYRIGSCGEVVAESANTTHYGAIEGKNQTAAEMVYNWANADKQFMYMKDWVKHLDSILTANGEDLLEDAGSVSHEQAVDKALGEYDKYVKQLADQPDGAELDFIRYLKNEVKEIGERK